MDSLSNKIEEARIMCEVNALTEKNTGERLVIFTLDEVKFINSKISSTEYVSLNSFIRKLIFHIPLIKAGSEKKEELEDSDFIYY